MVASKKHLMVGNMARTDELQAMLDTQAVPGLNTNLCGARSAQPQ
jgi:hypothetical protein